MSLKIEKHANIAMLAVSTLNTISSLISKASDNSISDEEYSLILLKFETFTRMKEDIRIKSKTSFEKTGDIETEASVYLIEIRQLHRLELMFKTMFKNRVRNRVQIPVQKPCSKPCSNPCSKLCSKPCSKPRSKSYSKK